MVNSDAAGRQLVLSSMVYTDRCLTWDAVIVIIQYIFRLHALIRYRMSVFIVIAVCPKY
jgi:hypothetical protein